MRLAVWLLAALAASAASACGDSTAPNRDPVAVVTLQPDSAVLGVGSQLALTATLRDANEKILTDRPIFWGAKDTAIAVVSQAGVVTARDTGTTQIAASSEGQNAIAVIVVARNAVSTVVVAPSPAQASVGDTVQFSAQTLDAAGDTLSGRPILWASSNQAVATIDPSSGRTIARAAGSTTISATSEGKHGTALLTVSLAPVVSVVVVPAHDTIVVGLTQQLTDTLRDARGNILVGRVVVWSSADSTIAKVSGTGLVTAIAAGSTTVTVSSEGKSAIASIVVLQAPVATVDVAPARDTIVVGLTQQLVDTLRDTRGTMLTGRVVVWASADTTIAKVSATGLVTAVGPGTTTITATSETKSGAATIVVLQAPVATVVVGPAHDTVVVGLTAQLVDTLRDARGVILTGRIVTWATGDASIATVSGSGLVTGVGPGTTTITATSETKTGTTTIVVLPVPVARVVVAPNPAQAAVGDTVQFSAQTLDAGGGNLPGRDILWASSNQAVATIDAASGIAVARAAGNTTISATSEGKRGTSLLTVSPAAVATVVVGPAHDTLVAGTTQQLVDTLRDAHGNILTGRPVVWASADPTIAKVSATGLVTAVDAGSTTVTATSGGKTGTAAIVVLQAPVAVVTVAPPLDSVVVGLTGQLAVTLRDAAGNVLTGRAVAWSSSDEGIATVSGTGLVTGLAPGTITITATSETKTGTATVVVVPVPVAAVIVAPPLDSVVIGLTAPLTATTKDAAGDVLAGRVVTWASSDEGIATVSAAGVVSGVGFGTATITATSETKSGTATVVVVPVPVATVIVAPAVDTVAIGLTVQLTDTLEDAVGNVLTGRIVTWASSDPTIATVDGNGLLTGVAEGTTTISAMSEGKTGSATIVVLTATPLPSRITRPRSTRP